MTFLMGLTLGFVVGMIVMALFTRIVRWIRALRHALHQALPRLKELGWVISGFIAVIIAGLMYWRVI